VIAVPREGRVGTVMVAVLSAGGDEDTTAPLRRAMARSPGGPELCGLLLEPATSRPRTEPNQRKERHGPAR
jgi:hypothetical protein